MKKKALVLIVLSIAMIFALSASAAAADDLSSFPAEVDPQSWKLYQNMTWSEWQENPIIHWEDDQLVL